MTGAELQKALDRAAQAPLVLDGGTYTTDRTLVVPSGAQVDGRGAVIRLTRDDVPVMVSAPYAGAGPITGSTRLRNLSLRGTKRGARQDGLVLYDFWSTIEGVEVHEVGGRGIVLADADGGGRAPTGTLVENQVRNCIVRGSGRTPYWLGESANGRLTDGVLANCIAVSGDGCRDPALFLGHAAGWTVDGLHTYGGAPVVALSVHNAYFTTIRNLYVERFERAGIELRQIQTQVSLAEAHLRSEPRDDAAAFLLVSGHDPAVQAVAMLGNCGFWHDEKRRIEAVRASGPSVLVVANGVALAGAGKALISPGALLDSVRSRF